jgi:hypothetical protein
VRALLLLSVSLLVGCHEAPAAKPPVQEARACPSVIPTPPPAPEPPSPKCDILRSCTFKEVSDKGAHELASLPLRDQHEFIVDHPTTAQLATLERISWVLRLRILGDIESLEPLSKLQLLGELTLDDQKDKPLGPLLAPLSKLSLLHTVRLGTSAPDAMGLAQLGRAKSLTLVPGPRDPSALSQIATLEELHIEWKAGAGAQVSALAKLSQLKSLSLLAPDLVTLPSLASMDHLEHLSLFGNARLVDVSVIAAIPHLSAVSLAGTAVRDLTPLLKSKSIKTATVPRELGNDATTKKQILALQKRGVEVTPYPQMPLGDPCCVDLAWP